MDKELEYLIQSRYSLLYVVSYEERRVIESLSKICDLDEINYNGVLVWDSTRGLQNAAGGTVASGESLVTPEQILDHILKKAAEMEGRKAESKQVRGPIYVLCDMFRYTQIGQGGGFTPEIERRLRILPDALKLTFMHAVIVSPILCLPTSLEKCVTVLDYPLPAKEQFSILVDFGLKKLVHRKRISQEEVNKISKENVVRSLLGLTIQEAQDALAKAFIVTNTFDIPTILQIKKQIIRKGQLLDYLYSEETMSNVGGFEGLKEFIRFRKNAFSDAAFTYGLPVPKGVFMLGIQGCGKSLAAKAIANELQVPLLKLDMGKMFGSLIGESEQKMRRALQLAESVAPCVLFIDEIDKSLAGGANTTSGDSGTTKRVIATLLDWMMEKTSPVFVVAASNSLNELPKPILRRGRFDECFFVDLPNDEERKEIFAIHLRKRKRDINNFDLTKLVNLTDKYSGAEIEAVIEDAMHIAFFDKGREFTTEDIINAVSLCNPQYKVVKEDIDRIKEQSRDRLRPVNMTMSQMIKVRSKHDGDRFDNV